MAHVGVLMDRQDPVAAPGVDWPGALWWPIADQSWLGLLAASERRLVQSAESNKGLSAIFSRAEKSALLPSAAYSRDDRLRQVRLNADLAFKSLDTSSTEHTW